ncbi:hypothetical protein IMCC12053_2134 [Celeribacter marinus]|uniref:Uncharacterized protein n=1 Tax=Celeribacter marinus TaxID=1397108 RepID=A0A0N9ZK85_9RHOB|nr:hypothetical protein IMCC12053_2134 [Celeribacter marinus]
MTLLPTTHNRRSNDFGKALPVLAGPFLLGCPLTASHAQISATPFNHAWQ